MKSQEIKKSIFQMVDKILLSLAGFSYDRLYMFLIHRLILYVCYLNPNQFRVYFVGKKLRMNLKMPRIN